MSCYVNMVRNLAVFNVYCSCECQSFQIPLQSLFLSLLLTLWFLMNNIPERVCAANIPFICDPLIPGYVLIQSTDATVRCGREESVYSFAVES